MLLGTVAENAAFVGARYRGYSDRMQGCAVAANPYPDRRTRLGRVTFSRAFRRAWAEGWTIADSECRQRERKDKPCRKPAPRRR